MYEGDKSCKALKVRIKILKFMRSLIGNQCRSFKMGVIWLNFEENVIKRAAAFCTYCSFLTAYFGRLYRRELQWSSLDEIKACTSVLSVPVDINFLIHVIDYEGDRMQIYKQY